MISNATLYSQGIGFYSLQGSFSYLSFCLAEGLHDLGVPVHANASCQAQDIGNFSFTATDPERLYSSALIVVDPYQLETEMATDALHLNLPFNHFIILAMNDALANFCPPPNIPLFCTHENRFYTLPGIRIPWAFGCSSQMIRKLQAKDTTRENRLIANFRPTFAQSVRQALDLCLVDHLKHVIEIDSALSDPGRWGDQHFEKLSTSIGCLAYGGYFAQDMHKAPYLAERLPPAKATFQRDTVILRWDSWRFWESLTAGCATVHLDFEKYGFMLPVMPVNGVHYIGIDLENIQATVKLLTGPRERLIDIGEQGKQWAITHYSPLAVAKRFLNHICMHQQLPSTLAGRPAELSINQRKVPSTRAPIVLDAVFFQYRATGIARVWQDILQQWASLPIADQLLILDRDNTCPRIPGLAYRTIPRHDYQHLDRDRLLLQQICNEVAARCFVSTYYTTPVSTDSLLMVHDCIPEALGADLNQPAWQEKKRSIAYAKSFCTVSGHTAADLFRYYPQVIGRPMSVIHNAASEIFKPAGNTEIAEFRTRYGVTKPYFLFVGPVEWYKNFRLFIEAFARLPGNEALQIVRTRGEDGDLTHPICADPHMVITTDRLSDPELSAAYSGALALVYPSWYEGFGLPVLEAMSCGCPVIAANATAIPEVAGNAALLIAPHDQESMLNALIAVQSEEVHQRLRLAGLEQARRFSWQSSAARLQELIFQIGEAQ